MPSTFAVMFGEPPEAVISRCVWTCRLFMSTWIIAGLLGCTAMRPEAASSSIVPITDVSAIVGKWGGTLKRVPGILPIDRVRLSIGQHATYVFSNDGLSDIVVGAGRLMIKNGKAVSDEAGRHVTLTLHEKNGMQTLVVDGIARNGDAFHVDLSRED